METKKINRHATIGAYAYPYNRIDMFDCREISKEEGNEKDLLTRLHNLEITYKNLGYKVNRLKVDRNKIQETHCILVKDVFVKKFNKRMRSLFIEVWIDL